MSAGNKKQTNHMMIDIELYGNLCIIAQFNLSERDGEILIGAVDLLFQ